MNKKECTLEKVMKNLHDEQILKDCFEITHHHQEVKIFSFLTTCC